DVAFGQGARLLRSVLLRLEYARGRPVGRDADRCAAVSQQHGPALFVINVAQADFIEVAAWLARQQVGQRARRAGDERGALAGNVSRELLRFFRPDGDNADNGNLAVRSVVREDPGLDGYQALHAVEGALGDGFVQVVFEKRLLLLDRDSSEFFCRNPLFDQLAIELLLYDGKGLVEQRFQATAASGGSRLQLGGRELVAVVGAIFVDGANGFRLQAAVVLHDEVSTHVEHG